MNFTWEIESLIVNPQTSGLNSVVVSANWRVWAEQDGTRGTSHGRVNFPAPEGDKFTAYSDLTEAQILSWVWEIGASSDPDLPWSKEIAEGQATASLQSTLAAITEKPLPWVPPPPPQPERATLEQRTEALEILIDILLEPTP